MPAPVGGALDLLRAQDPARARAGRRGGRVRWSAAEALRHHRAAAPRRGREVARRAGRARTGRRAGRHGRRPPRSPPPPGPGLAASAAADQGGQTRSCVVRSASLLQRRHLPGVAVGADPLPCAACALRLLVPWSSWRLALVSCGGESDRADVENLLDQAFSQSIKSADLKVDARLQLKGSESLDRPVRIQASGPFRTNKGKLPVRRPRAEGGHRGRRPDRPDRLPVHGRPRLREVRGRLLRAAGRPGPGRQRLDPQGRRARHLAALARARPAQLALRGRGGGRRARGRRRDEPRVRPARRGQR